MLNILKDPKKIGHIFSTVWILIFDKRKESYIFSTVCIPIFDKRKDWCYLSILFYSAHKRNLLFHYHEYSACH